MKIRIDKEHITIAQKAEAEAMAKDESWIDAETLQNCAARILKAHHETETIFVEKLLSTGSLTVTVNHWNLTVWVDGVTVEYTAEARPSIAIIAFDVLRECREEGRPEAFLQVFTRTHCGTV